MKAKKLFLLSLFLLLGIANVHAGEDIPVSVNQLPRKAQELIQTHFADVQVSHSKKDNDFFDKSYEVFFVDGSKIEFDHRGEWKEIKAKYSKVPVHIIPQPISEFISKNHAEKCVIQIDRNRKEYEVKLNNGLEIKFDRHYNFIKYD